MHTIFIIEETNHIVVAYWWLNFASKWNFIERRIAATVFLAGRELIEW